MRVAHGATGERDTKIGRQGHRQFRRGALLSSSTETIVDVPRMPMLMRPTLARLDFGDHASDEPTRLRQRRDTSSRSRRRAFWRRVSRLVLQPLWCACPLSGACHNAYQPIASLAWTLVGRGRRCCSRGAGGRANVVDGSGTIRPLCAGLSWPSSAADRRSDGYVRDTRPRWPASTNVSHSR